MNYAYFRQMTNQSHMSEQQRNILFFAMEEKLKIDKEVVEYSSKNHTIEERKKFETFMHSLEEGSGLLVDTVSVLSNRAEELIKIINCMLSRKIDLYIASSKVHLHKDTTVIEIFPLLNDLRETEKATSTQIGRPKGSRSPSKFDVYQSQVVSLLKEGMNVSAIARELGVSRSSLKDYIESRDIKALAEGSWMEVLQPQTNLGVETTLLVCPFEEKINTHKRG